MKKRKISTSGENTSTRQNSKPVIGPRCQRAVISCPLAAITRDAGGEREPEADRDRRAGAGARGSRSAPTRMIASASTIHGDIGPHQRASGSARVGAEQHEAEHEAEVRRVEDVVPAEADQVLREDRDGRRAGEDPPALHAPPVAVLGAGHAQDERDAVAGQQRARRPHDHALAAERDRELEHRAREQRDEDLGDRELEAERRLAEDLQRDDHGREVQPRVAHRRQQDGVGRAADPERRPLPGRPGWMRSSGAMVPPEARSERSAKPRSDRRRPLGRALCAARPPVALFFEVMLRIRARTRHR